jgi:hypothetical protein
MGPNPYGQPEPFQAGPGPVPVVQPKPRSNRRFLPVAVAVVVAVVAFAGGYAVATATASKATATGANGFGNDNGQGFVPGASGRPRGNGGAGGFGGGASGTVGSVSADQMTITTQNGGSKIVLLTPTTTVTEVTSATKSVGDLTSGQTVTVVGTSNPDGSVTATRIVVGDANVFGGRFQGPGGSPAPSTNP